MLFSQQFGFQASLLTEHAVIEIADEITNGFMENKYTIGIFIDISKEFVAVDHKILIKKLAIIA